MEKQKMGISLIVLVITIIIMIILAATIIISLNNVNIIDTANKAVRDTNLKQIQTQSELLWMEWYNSFQNESPNEYVISRLDSEVLKNYIILANDMGVTVRMNVWDSTKNVNKPVLRDGMTAVKFDYSKNEWINVSKSEIESGAWYDYTNKQWANAKSSDGSYWVWVPRYEYKIDSINKVIDINFIRTDTIVPTSGYIIHPAFKDESSISYANGGWDTELDGIWVAKYEMSMVDENNNHINTTNAADDTNGNVSVSNTRKMVSVPGVTSWRWTTVDNAFNNCKKYSSSSSLNDYDSHLIKNSEWGAVAYLARSEYGTIYGKDTNYDDINMSEYITGGSQVISEIYINNITQSSTGTVYGIYDLAGGAGECIAAFNAAYSGNYYNNGFATYLSRSTKYATAYSNSIDDYNSQSVVLSTSKIGDATKEVWTSRSYAWNNDRSYVVCSTGPYMGRGGSAKETNNDYSRSGFFSSASGTGRAYENVGFRVVLCAR